MFITVEGRMHWGAEEKFMEELIREVDKGNLTYNTIPGSSALLVHIRSKPKPVDYLFLSGILSLIDCRSSIGRENSEVAYWLLEHRKVGVECIVLSDIFRLDYIDIRIRRLVTHRILVVDRKDKVLYNIVNLSIGRRVRGVLGDGSILDALETSDKPLTQEEIEQQEKALGEMLEETPGDKPEGEEAT